MGSTPSIVVEYSQRKDMARKKSRPIRLAHVRTTVVAKKKKEIHYVKPPERHRLYTVRQIWQVNRFDEVDEDLWEEVMAWEWQPDGLLVPHTPGREPDIGEHAHIHPVYGFQCICMNWRDEN